LISFDDATTKVTLFGELIKIVQKATVKNPSKLKGKDATAI
jgi:hypothetical protein